MPLDDYQEPPEPNEEEIAEARSRESSCSTGRDRLWGYFGLSRASWLTMPRVMCHAMPDEWQNKMAALMEEWDETWTNMPHLGTRVQVTKGGKLQKVPDWLINYRHPDHRAIEDMKSRFYG